LDSRTLLVPKTNKGKGPRRGVFTLLVLTIIAIVCAAPRPTLRAQTPPSDSQAATAAPRITTLSPLWALERRWTVGFQLSYGLENNIPHNISHVNMIIAAPQIGLVVWDSPRSRLPMNRFEIISEGLLGSAYHPGGHLLGDTLLFRFDFKPFRSTTPFFDAGIAALHTSLDERAPEISGHTQFHSQGGVGVQYFVRPGRAIVFEYRYFHMSNAGIQEPNHGFNGNMLSVGFRWFLRRRAVVR
jgi:Lipid A 3-O-deacylase (PagL)